jgi:hypothetical protein
MTKRKTNQRDQKRTVKKNRRTQESVTIGMDLGDKTSRYCVLNSEGEILREVQAATTKAGMLEKFGSLGRARIAIEVGTHSPWVSRLLRSLGHELIVANPRQVKLITESTRKDDRLDAQTLGRLARIDPALLRPIQHRSEKAQTALMVIRCTRSKLRTPNWHRSENSTKSAEEVGRFGDGSCTRGREHSEPPAGRRKTVVPHDQKMYLTRGGLLMEVARHPLRAA